MIDIPVALGTQLATGRCQPAELIRLDLATLGLLRFTTAAQDVVFAGNTWKAGEGVIEINSPEEDAENVAAELSMTLSLKRLDIREEFMNQNQEGREIRVWLVVLNTDTGQVIGDAIDLSTRYISIDEISRGPTTMEVRVLGESILTKQLDATRAARADAPQQQRYPGDRFFADLGKLARGLSVTLQTINVRRR